MAEDIIGRICVAAYGITDPVNVGSIFRICDSVRCEEVILIDCLRGDEAKIRKVSRHTSQIVAHRFVSKLNFLSSLDRYPPLIALEITSSSTDLYTTPLPQDVTLVVGGESQGVPEDVLEKCILAVHLPMFGVNSSMNVATSLGIALYEIRRRWNY